MRYLTQLETFNSEGKYKEVIKNEYLKFKGDSLINAIFRCFVFKPNKDLEMFGKRRKNLGGLYAFDELDLMKKTTFKYLAIEMDSINFINKQLKPKSKREFYLAQYALNKEIDLLSKQLRAILHRHYGLRLYQIPDYYYDGRPIKKFCLVPTDPKAMDLLKTHPAYSRTLLSELEHRAKVTERIIGSRKNKLETFQKNMLDVLNKIKKVKRKEGWN